MLCSCYFFKKNLYLLYNYLRKNISKVKKIRISYKNYINKEKDKSNMFIDIDMS